MLRDRLRTHVETLAGEIGERNVFRPRALRDAAGFIEREWQAEGYEVRPLRYAVQGVTCANLEVTCRGRSRPEKIILVGAHYDSVPGSPGADDNASGVAALLEISRFVLGAAPAATVRCVAFVNEEPPFFLTEAMGSRRYARAARAAGEDIRLMLSLETIGYYSRTPGSQRYPPLVGRFHPDRADFVAFVSNLRSRAALRRAVAAFRAGSDFPVEHTATFGLIPGVGWSDHASFWREGYRAVMVTDTALYRYPYYHDVEDTPDKLDFEALARVTDGLSRAVASLAGDDS
jgi:Zn-dependent M28 family amino/carboxypeptidase